MATRAHFDRSVGRTALTSSLSLTSLQRLAQGQEDVTDDEIADFELLGRCICRAGRGRAA